jgi:copper chaperone CopZ
MKTLNLLLTVLIATAINVSLYAQTHDSNTVNHASTRTESFKVYGNCEMCKDRIEKAVKEKGATSASWDTKTKMLTVTYDLSKTNKDKLSKKLASVGHDTEKYKAPDDIYDKLPVCCHYERAR